LPKTLRADKNRLIAAPFFSNFVKSDFIGIENKVNYIYRPKGHLARNEVIGLCALLNSRVFDAYFRIFNGNVNVSATELREMSLPPMEIIKQIGDTIILSDDFSVENTNKIVNTYFETIYTKILTALCSWGRDDSKNSNMSEVNASKLNFPDYSKSKK
jgi:adenine-specific DNA-methyltransferase